MTIFLIIFNLKIAMMISAEQNLIQ